ncbi:SCO family protein [Pseudobythopirellula maris]|nr:SCO family protein [Pseudobythopirellula maris]
MSHSRIIPTLAMLALAACVALPVRAQLIEDLPDEMQGVGVDDKSGDQLPLDLMFRDENGKNVSLRDVFGGERPVLLSLNYSDCPMLCGVQLNALVDTLSEMEWTAGQEFDVVSVSVDPLETTLRAKQTEQKYLNRYGRPGAGAGWRFLTGRQKNIRALADAVGFRYKYIPETKEYSHTAVEIVVTPDGVVSRYLYGVMYDPQTVRLSLVEAADGRVGSPLDRLILFCFHYDETKGRYGPVAKRIMSAGAAMTVFALVVGLTPYWLKRAQAHPAPHDAAATPTDETEAQAPAAGDDR